MASVLAGKLVPMLPWPLDIMNEAECIKYLLPEIKKDIAENTGRTVSRRVATKIFEGFGEALFKEFFYRSGTCINRTLH